MIDKIATLELLFMYNGIFSGDLTGIFSADLTETKNFNILVFFKNFRTSSTE